jgi:GABA(A) receptor-associated protein
MDIFKNKHTFSERVNLARKITDSHPDRIPIIVEKRKGTRIGDINKSKFLVPNDITIGKFIIEIRKHIEITPEQAIYIFVGDGTIPQSSTLISHIYRQYKDNDGFLYMTYSGENTFG